MQEGPVLLNHEQAKSRALSSSAEALIAVKNGDSRSNAGPLSNPATELGDVCQEFISMLHFYLFPCTFLNAHRSFLDCLWDSADREVQCSLP